jgi:hypothetical protein
MWTLGLIVALFVQPQVQPQAAVRVVVGLTNGQQVVIVNPQFSGFIHGRNADVVLRYRQEMLQGQMPSSTISRIDFGQYKRGEPFPMTVTLRNGQKLEVVSERQDFVTITGLTDVGVVTIKHPNPNSTPLRLSKNKADRKNDLTIQYLEFPAS